MGNGITRCFVLALPSHSVAAMLPMGLDLGCQDVVPQGMHPLIFQFHGFSECQFSFPTLLRSMRFNEQTVGIPFTYVRGGRGLRPDSGPYYYMPKLYLDDLWVLMNGRFWWGFNKEMTKVEVTDRRYAVTSLAGQRLISLEWNSYGDAGARETTGYREFEPLRQMLSQTLISDTPASLGPFFSLTDFDRRWHLTTARPLDSAVEIDPSYMPRFEGGRFTASGVPASFELVGPWWLSLPYQQIQPPDAPPLWGFA
jgi:hypothetical protein